MNLRLHSSARKAWLRAAPPALFLLLGFALGWVATHPVKSANSPAPRRMIAYPGGADSKDKQADSSVSAAASSTAAGQERTIAAAGDKSSAATSGKSERENAKRAKTEQRKSEQRESDQPIVRLAKKASPAVVCIGAVRTTYVQDGDPMFRDFFAPFMVYPQKQKIPYLGSGFIIDSDGTLLTNYHVIEDAERIFATLPDGRELTATLLDADRFADVAMLKIEGKNFPSISLGDSDTLQIGEAAVAFGNPFGNYIEDPQPSITAGVISALHRSFKPDINAQRVYQDMIQTDAAINPGNSGGPLMNLDGKVIGMNTFIVSTTGGSVGLGFAIPSSHLRVIVEEIRKYGHLRPLLVDFDLAPLTPRLAAQLGVNAQSGAVVRSLLRGGPGEKSGLRVGDTIVKLDGKAVRSIQDLYLYVAAKQVGDKVQFEIQREGQTIPITYTLMEGKRQPRNQ